MWRAFSGFTLILALAVGGCDREPSPENGRASRGHASGQHATLLDDAPPVEDLPQIRRHRALRVLLPGLRAEMTFSPDKASAHRYEVALIKKFAEQHFVEVEWIHVERWDDLIPTLLDGDGDLIAANLTVTHARKRQVAFTVPIHTVREKLVVRSGDRIASGSDLAHRRIAIRQQSSFWNIVERLRRSHAHIEVQILPENVPVRAVLNAISAGEIDIAAVDVTELERTPAEWPDLKVVEGLFEDDATAWGVRPNAVELLQALNVFLNKEQLKRQTRRIYKADLPEIRRRKVLRVLTRNDVASYFVWRGEILGFEYELLEKFAAAQGLSLEMVVPSSSRDLIPTLLEGGGDMLAASLTITDTRKERGLAFTRPYNWVSEMVVSRAGEAELNIPVDLAGRTLVVSPSSAHWDTLSRLQGDGIDIVLEPAPEHLETPDVVAKVASGEYDLTVVDSHLLDIELRWRDDVEAAFPLTGPVPHGWAVRAEDAALLGALDAFLDREYRGLDYNLLHAKYFGSIGRAASRDAVAPTERSVQGELSPYDEVIRNHADRLGLDWLLIVALAYEESRFDPQAVSWAGARGIMQVMPRTARHFGGGDLHDVEVNIETGVRYLAWLHERFEPELSVQDRMWFALAAYNAGIGHVRDARSLATTMGWDANQWFDNVEQAMLLLSRRSFYQTATHGYVRGQETADYVRAIRERYNAYVRLTETS